MNFKCITLSWTPNRLILGAAVLVLMGCGTMVTSDARQFIEITTISSNQESLGNADCVLKNDQGTWSVVSPGSVQVVSSGTPLHITCHKTGYLVGVNRLDAVREGYVMGDMGTLGKLVIGGATTQKPAFMTQGADAPPKRYPASVVVVLDRQIEAAKVQATGGSLMPLEPSQAGMDLNSAQKTCVEIGLIKGSEPFGMCVLKLMK